MLIISKSAKINKDTELIVNCGEIHIGENCHIKKGVVINCYGGIVRIGDNVTIGEYSVLYGHGGIDIGSNVAIAPHCVLSAQKHIFPSRVPLRYSGEMINSIAIQDNCIISAHVSIRDGVTVGRNSFIGAGSVLTKSLPESIFACGNPCKVIGILDRNRLYGHAERSEQEKC